MSKITEWFNNHTTTDDNIHDGIDDEFLMFERIQNPPSHRRDLCAFLLLDKLVPGLLTIVSCAEHDQIWLGVNDDDLEEVATEDDIVYLLRCGVWHDDDEECLCMFV
jgi:hypothetical protein